MPHRKQLLLFFQFFEKIHFVKDPFMVPYILGQRLGYKVSILYPRLPQNKDLPSEYSGVSLLPISVNLAGATTTLEEKYSNVIDYVYDHSKEIDILMLFFGDSISEPIAKSYKRGNKKGKIYVNGALLTPYQWWSVVKDISQDGFRRIIYKMPHAKNVKNPRAYFLASVYNEATTEKLEMPFYCESPIDIFANVM